MASKTPRVIKYGNDLFFEIKYPDSHKIFKITYWDLWVVIILVNTFNRDWEEMIGYLRCKAKESSYSRNNFDGLLNHIQLLRQTLTKVGLSVDNILEETDAPFIKKQELKAKRKILEMEFNSNEKSPWMIYTPKKKLYMRAMHGHWNHFPVNPKQYANSLERLFKSSGHYSENQSFSLETKLSNFINKHEARASYHELFALYRAFLTVVIEKMDMIDDSCGVIGDLYEEIFKKYFILDRTTLDTPLSDFFLDFIELIIWEDYWDKGDIMLRVELCCEVES